jgi:hypothetical protein
MRKKPVPVNCMLNAREGNKNKNNAALAVSWKGTYIYHP